MTAQVTNPAPRTNSKISHHHLLSPSCVVVLTTVTEAELDDATAGIAWFEVLVEVAVATGATVVVVVVDAVVGGDVVVGADTLVGVAAVTAVAVVGGGAVVVGAVVVGGADGLVVVEGCAAVVTGALAVDGVVDVRSSVVTVELFGTSVDGSDGGFDPTAPLPVPPPHPASRTATRPISGQLLRMCRCSGRDAARVVTQAG